MGLIFDGKSYAGKILADVQKKVAEISSKMRRRPKLAVILNPQDQGSVIYTHIKAKRAEELGIDFQKIQMANTNTPLNSKLQISKLITDLDYDETVDGIMIQLPLTGDKELDGQLCEIIKTTKDADGLNPASGVVPATVRAVMRILDQSGADAYGHIGIIGNKGQVGRRLQQELKKSKYKFISGTDIEQDLEEMGNMDVLISATGQAGLIKPDMVKEGAIVIDVGFPKGDFDPAVAAKAKFFTPVPGGVGPVTVAMLFENLVDLIC